MELFFLMPSLLFFFSLGSWHLPFWLCWKTGLLQSCSESPLPKLCLIMLYKNWFNYTFIFSWIPDPDSEEEKDIDASVLKPKWKHQAFSGHLQQRSPKRRQTFCYIWWDGPVFPSMNTGENGRVLFLTIYKLNDSFALSYLWKKNLIEQLWAGSILLYFENC